MENSILLYGLLLTPILGIALIWIYPNYSKTNLKIGKFYIKISLFFTLINLWNILLLFHLYDGNFNNLQFNLNIMGKLIGGLDGISIWKILLVNIIIPVVILLSWKEIKMDAIKKNGISENYLFKNYLTLILLVNFFSIAVFLVSDLLLFYIFFEAILIPMYSLIGYFGSRNKRIESAQNTFFLYTLFGSLFMLFAIITIYISIGATDYQTLLSVPISESMQYYLFLGFFIALAVKTPSFPFHGWLPLAHGESGTGTSVILAAILLKLAMKVAKMGKINKSSLIGWAIKQRWGINRIGPHNKEVLEVIFGSLLGDGHLRLTPSSKSVHLVIKKGNSESARAYANWINNFFYERDYVAHSKPNLNIYDTQTQNYYNIYTVKFTSLVWIHDIFYNTNGKKVVPKEIKEYLSPLALAVWFKDYGSIHNKSSAKLATNSFTYSECEILQGLLKELYDLKVSINKSGNPNQYTLYIWKESMPKFHKLVRPYLID